MEPSVGRIVHYRLTRENALVANGNRQRAVEHSGQYQSHGLQMFEGNLHYAGDVLPLLITAVWEDEFDVNRSVCRDYMPGDDDNVEWSFPSSCWGVNGQVFLDGNFSIWVTSAPQGDANGFWCWPEHIAVFTPSRWVDDNLTGNDMDEVRDDNDVTVWPV